MKIETGTAWLPVLDVCTYWGGLSYMVEGMREGVAITELDPYIIEHASETIKEVLKYDMHLFNDVKITECKIFRPAAYNYSGDEMEFTMEVDDREFAEFMDECNLSDGEMYAFFDEKYGSHSGFISTMPYTEKKFCKAFASPVNSIELAKAFSMFLWYRIYTQLTERELDMIQESFVDDVMEDVNGNTDFMAEDEDD